MTSTHPEPTAHAGGVDVTGVSLDHRALPDELVMDGSPTTAHRALTDLAGLTIGVWEHTPGTSRDVEADEVFFVVDGRGIVEFEDGSPAVDLRPGTLVRLQAGQRTVWTVHETLRKIYIS
ncbi:cupin domain-containing protein [Prescottella agglutinans]|uniref:cupin domain-containing protein n=1 Tax=Prescottella agglutinans TaxID=1644129 RepID=UPI003D994DCD